MNKRQLPYLISSLLLSTSMVLAEVSNSALSDTVIPLQTEGTQRTAPLFEAGAPFLNTGDIPAGFEAPGGAIWQPQFLVWGDMRSALQHFDDGETSSTEWANRLNLFAQLKLTGTERLVMSMRPLDDLGRFSGRQFGPSDQKKTVNGFNTRVHTLYFEGELGEIFPNLDKKDTKGLDWGFAIGRQPVFIQDGMMINDNIDAIGIVRNALTLPGVTNLRITGMAGWNHVNRDNNNRDDAAKLFGLFSEMDLASSTVNIDYAYVNSGDINTGDGQFFGLSSIQRIGHLNTNIRYLYSHAEQADNASVSTGSLLFGEISWTPTKTHDNVYLSGFYAQNKYASVARNDDVGGALGNVGILFASSGIGSYRAPLSNSADDVHGGALGYQLFLPARQQLILEVGYREENKGINTGAYAVGVRYQKALGQHTIVRMDAFIGERELNSTDSNDMSGGRLEIRYKF